MLNELEYQGKWWLPEAPEEIIDGTLKFIPVRGANLNLNGAFMSIEDINRGFIERDIVLGFSLDGKPLTLYRCSDVSKTLSAPGYHVSEIRASVLFVGVHFEKSDNIKFQSISIRYSYLDEWINKTGFDRLQLLPDQNSKIYGIDMNYRLPEAYQVGSVNEFIIKINFSGPIVSYLPEKFSVAHETQISLKSLNEEAKSFESYIKIFSLIESFLSFAVMNPVYPIYIRGNRSSENSLIKIFYKLPDIPTSSERLQPQDMLFTFNDISEELGTCFENWIENFELLEPVNTLYFDTIYNPRIQLKNSFLSLVQAIESYHRRRYGGKYQTDTDYQSGIYKKLVEIVHSSSLDKTFKEALVNPDGIGGKLKYLNEYSLPKRLKDLHREHNNVASLLIPDRKRFARDVADTRNYLTHYDETLRGKAKQGKELYKITEQLKFLLEVCFLYELGLSEEKIKQLVERNQRYMFLRAEYIVNQNN